MGQLNQLALLTISRFCDVQGVKHVDRMVLQKMFPLQTKNYKEWFDIITPNFPYYEKRDDFYEEKSEMKKVEKNNKKQKI